jgi:putative peptidoglycan lipid II flippase
MDTFAVGLGAPVYMPWLGQGFDSVERARAIQASQRMLPAINLMGLAIMGGAVLQAYRRFAIPAFTTAAYNLTFIVVLLASPLMPLENRAAWGVTLGAAVALALQWPVWQRFFSPLRSETGDRLKTGFAAPWLWLEQIARLAGPLGIGYAVHHLILFVDRSMATTLGAGSVAALDYAYRLAQVVGQLGGLAVSTVLFPSLIEQI